MMLLPIYYRMIPRKPLYTPIFNPSAKGVGLLKGARVQIPASPLKSLKSVRFGGFLLPKMTEIHETCENTAKRQGRESLPKI
jgi:hypothetical protein